MKVTILNDKSVASCSAHCELSFWNRRDISPFMLIYAILMLALAHVLQSRGYASMSEWETLGWSVAFVGAVAIQGIVLLCGFWSVLVRRSLRYRKAKSLEEAEFICVVPSAHNGSPGLCKLKHLTKPLEGDSHGPTTNEFNLDLPQYWFEFQKRKYGIEPSSASSDSEIAFVPLDFPVTLKLKDYLSWAGYNSGNRFSHVLALAKWGKNELDIPSPSMKELFIEHALAPFFLFQVFCVGLWCLDEYWYYSVFTLIMLVVFELTMCKQQQQNLGQLRGMRRPPFPIYVFREKQWVRIMSCDLLPGDVCSVLPFNTVLQAANSQHDKDAILMPCDVILIRGSCICNEAMLTGESIPKMKDSVLSAVHGERSVGEARLDMDAAEFQQHIIMAGTKLMQHAPEPHDTKLCAKFLKAPPDGGCIAVVLRTGFYSGQGSLMRTILFSTQRVTADNMETFVFILVLVVFAIVASVYVLVEGLKNEKASRWKLFLHCTMIITSTVPPELPMELSLAVNTSLSRLLRLAIYCTEPYRIPFAGRLDVCCFDKTGTLTSDQYFVKGIAMDLDKEPGKLTDPLLCERETGLVLAACHQLVRLRNAVEGDPMEQAAVRAVRWAMNREGNMERKLTDDVAAAIPPSPVAGRKELIKFVHRHPFSSQMKRMSAIIQVGVIAKQNGKVSAVGSFETFAVCKGAPEVLQPLFSSLPSNYESSYKHYMLQGARVLALGCKRIPKSTNTSVEKLKLMTRQSVESKLAFAGFLVLDCPLKDESEDTISQLLYSGHRISIITGDNALTACDVARKLTLLKQDYRRILNLTGNTHAELKWECLDPDHDFSLPFECELSSIQKLVMNDHELVVTGQALEVLELSMSVDEFRTVLTSLSPHVVVFARVSPRHKELILAALKSAGLHCLMCGDGTNDVGALKQADVGVSILNSPEYEEAIKSAKDSLAKRIPRKVLDEMSAAQRIRAELTAMEQAESGSTMVQLGDASIASPFTSKTPSIMSTVHIVRQGRCTLVTTIQMYKILALNCLISAYTLSSLYLYGVKQGDTQATLAGLLIAGLFMCIAWAEPVEKLSPDRPVSKIFSPSVMMSLFGQLAVHFATLFAVLHITEPFVETSAEEMDPDADFKPNVINTAVFLTGLTMQCNVFAANYTGHPFMQSLLENKGFSRLLGATWLLSIFLTLDLSPEIGEYFELVAIPKKDDYQNHLITILLVNTAASWIWERLIRYTI